MFQLESRISKLQQSNDAYIQRLDLRGMAQKWHICQMLRSKFFLAHAHGQERNLILTFDRCEIFVSIAWALQLLKNKMYFQSGVLAIQALNCCSRSRKSHQSSFFVILIIHTQLMSTLLFKRTDRAAFSIKIGLRRF